MQISHACSCLFGTSARSFCLIEVSATYKFIPVSWLVCSNACRKLWWGGMKSPRAITRTKGCRVIMKWQFALSGYPMMLCLMCVLKRTPSLSCTLYWFYSIVHLKTHTPHIADCLYHCYRLPSCIFIAIFNKCNVECKLRNARYQTNDIINMRSIASSTIRNAFKCSDYNIRMILQWIRIASIRQNRSTVKMQYIAIDR